MRSEEPFASNEDRQKTGICKPEKDVKTDALHRAWKTIKGTIEEDYINKKSARLRGFGLQTYFKYG